MPANSAGAQSNPILDSERISEEEWNANAAHLDRLYWEDHIQPYVGQTCALAACHGGFRAAKLHFERPDINGRFEIEQSKFNFDMVRWYVRPNDPDTSRFVIKPLAPEDGGIEHSGGNKLQRTSYVYQRFVDWINGAAVGNVAPMAEAGTSLRVQMGTVALLDGRASTDRNGDVLNYEWKLVRAPEGSTSQPADTDAPRARIVPDLQGDYVLELIVNDGELQSLADEVTVSAFKLLGGMQLAEAETGRLEAPMDVVEDPTANGGFHIRSGEQDKGKAQFSAPITEEGAYAVYARVFAPTAGNDTITVRFDDGDPVTWTVPVADDWKFEPCRLPDGAVAAFTLAAGPHELTLGTVKPGLRIDRILITKADAESQLTPESRQFVKEFYLDLLQRGPSQAELLYAAGLDRRQLVEFLFDSYEYHDRWYRDQLYFMFLLREFDPRGVPWMAEIPAHLYEGEMNQLEALQALATSQFFHFRNLGPNNYTLAVFEHFLGRLPNEAENKDSNFMFNGNPTELLSKPGNKQFDVASIVLHNGHAIRHYVKRMYTRYFEGEIDEAELASATQLLMAEPEKVLDIQLQWVLSDRYFAHVPKLRPKSDIQYIRMLYVDLLNREPTQDEFDYVQNALQSFADPIPLRSVIAKILLDSKFVQIPAKPVEDAMPDWIRAQYLRFLSRGPGEAEMDATLTALRAEGVTCKTIWQGILSSQEYQFY